MLYMLYWIMSRIRSFCIVIIHIIKSKLPLNHTIKLHLAIHVGNTLDSTISNRTDDDKYFFILHDTTCPEVYTQTQMFLHPLGVFQVKNVMWKVSHIPEHSSVLFVPSLYPVLPLLFGQLVLLQDSAHTNTMYSPEGMSSGT